MGSRPAKDQPRAPHARDGIVAGMHDCNSVRRKNGKPTLPNDTSLRHARVYLYSIFRIS